MLLATERVKLQVSTGLVFMICSIAATWFVLSLGWASQGLALKMIVLQLVQVNVVAWLIARGADWEFDWIYQPTSIFICLSLGWMVRLAAEAGLSAPISLPVAGILYASGLATLVYTLPSLAGLNRGDIAIELSKIGRLYKRRD